MASNKRDSEAVRRARQDIADRARELDEAVRRVKVAREKLHMAHVALDKLLEGNGNGKK